MASPSSARSLSILLVKPKPRLGTIHALHRYQTLEPIELGYLAAAAGREHEIRVLDLRFEAFPERAFRKTLRKFDPDIVGITGYTHEAAAVKALSQIVRAEGSRAKVIVGGHHATVAYDDYDIPSIDAIVRGEGCAAFRTFVDAVAQGAPLHEVPGLLIPGRIEKKGAESWPSFPNPATLPTPRRDLWDPRRYFCVWVTEEAANFQRLFPMTAMVRTSFGCRMKCSFCIVPKLFNGHHHPRPADLVAEEIANVPANHIYFCDDENFIDAEFAHELADALERRGVKKRYFAWTRATTVNRFPDLFQRWRALGLDAAFLGFEFPTDEQLKATRKGSTVAQNELAHEALRKAKVAVHAAFMLMPEFEEGDFATLRKYVDAMPPAQFSFTVCTPSPGTDDYVAMREKICVDDEYGLHDCMHPLTPTRLPLRDYFALYARQIKEAGKKNPLRVAGRPIHPADIPRLVNAEMRYARAFAGAWRDYA